MGSVDRTIRGAMMIALLGVGVWMALAPWLAV